MIVRTGQIVLRVDFCNRLLKIERLQRFPGKGGSGATKTVSDEVNRDKTSRRKSFAPVIPDQYRATGRRVAEGLRVQATEDPNPESSTNPMFMDVGTPVIHPQRIETVAWGQLGSTTPGTDDTVASPQSDARMANVRCGELDMEMVLENVNATRAVYPEHKGIHSFWGESLGQSSTGTRVACMRRQNAHMARAMRTAGRTFCRLLFEPLSTPGVGAIESVSGRRTFVWSQQAALAYASSSSIRVSHVAISKQTDHHYIALSGFLVVFEVFEGLAPGAIEDPARRLLVQTATEGQMGPTADRRHFHLKHSASAERGFLVY